MRISANTRIAFRSFCSPKPTADKLISTLKKSNPEAPDELPALSEVAHPLRLSSARILLSPSCPT